MKIRVDRNGKVKLTKFGRLLFHFEVFLGKVPDSFRAYKWHSYNPTWLVELAQIQCPSEKWLHTALGKCTQASGHIPYIYFVNPCRPNKSGSEWQFEKSLTLEDPEKGELILDILKDGRIGGIEFFGVLLRAS